MKNFSRFLAVWFLCAAPFLSSCSKPSADSIAKAIKEDPGILTEVIKKDREAFGKALMQAQQNLQGASRKEEAEKTAQEQEKAFKDPLKPKLSKAQVYKGKDSAKIVIVEYTDFQCPYCSKGSDVMKEVLKRYDGKVKVTTKHLPLERIHPHAMAAAKYYEAIRIQNPAAAIKFHDALFAGQDELRKDGDKFLAAQAKKTGVKMDKLNKDLNSSEVTGKVKEDMDEAMKFGFQSTPSFLVGGVPVKGAYPPEEFGKVIDRILGGKG